MAVASYRVLPWRFGAYLLLALGVTWPAVLQLGRAVPGAARTDLHNALWSIWFFTSQLQAGELPWHTRLLDAPGGGTLLVADPVNALLAVPLTPLFGLSATYSILVIGQLALAGWAAHRLARAVADDLGLPGEQAGWVAGVGYGTACVLRAAVHNGTSEGISGGLAALAAWACWRAARHGGARRVLLAALALGLAALGSWYGAVVAFAFAGALWVVGLPAGWRNGLGARTAALMLGLALAVPLAASVREAASGADNLVRIKHPRELMTVRRSTGPADLRGYVMPGDFRSPDFREISRYGEQFFHCHYLGWVLILGALLTLRRRRGTGWLWLAGLGCLLLSLGPVAVRDGSAWIILDDRAIPLPYLLVEGLPGFSSLSLLYRLAQGPALAFAVLAGLGVAGLPRPRGASLAVVLLVLLEARLVAPMGSMPDTTSTLPAPGLLALAQAPRGIVLNYPVVGGRAYLHEQTIHGQPLAGTLNFPNNAAGVRAWRGLISAASDFSAPAPEQDDTLDGSVAPDLAAFRHEAADRARAAGVRYVVVHDDPWARPDMQDDAVEIIERAYAPLSISDGRAAADDSVRVYQLW